MNRILTVARWEYLEKLKSKAFLVSLFLMPLIMIGMGVIPSLLASRPDKESKIIGVIDMSGEIVQPLGTYLEHRFKLPDGKPNYILRNITIAGKDSITAKKFADSLAKAEEIEGYVIVSKTIMTDSSVDYHSQNVGNFKVIERLSKSIRDVIIEKKLTSKGVDSSLVQELKRPFDIKTIKLSKTGKDEETDTGQVFLSAYIFLMMMMFLVMTSGQLLVRSMLEEKSNRVVEILMSSCTPGQLMSGKILGLSGLGFTQLGFWSLIGVAMSLQFSVNIFAGAHVVILLIYFVLGYFLYSAIFVAAGSPISTEQEAQQINSYLVLMLFVPMMLMPVLMQEPNSTLAKVLSFIPVLTPTMMAMRISVQMPSVVEIVLTMFLLLISTVIAMWAAGKIFRTAFLVYGKRPSIGELITLLRTP